MLLTRQRVLLLLLLVAAVVPYFVDLGGSSIWDANEAFYVETPREMIERGDYVSPTFNYEPRFNKPVLSYWIVAAFYHLFGISVGVERVPIALGALAMILTAFALARLAWAGSSPASEAALWAALGLAVTPRLLMFSRRIFIDIYISMFMALTLLAFALAERYPARRKTFLSLMYVAAGLGVLTKGPIAVALPVVVFGAYLVLHGELKRLREMMLPTGALLAAAIVVPWYAALYYRSGWTYIASFIQGENIARYTDGVGVQISRGPFFYVPVVFSDSFPWSMFLPAAALLWFADRRASTAAGVPAEARRIRTLLWLWIVLIIAFFTFSAAKQDLYIFPIVPAVAALAGDFIGRAITGSGTAATAWLRWTAVVSGGLLSAAGSGALYVFHAAGNVYALDGAAVIGVAGTLGGLSVLALALSRRPRAALVTLVATLIVVNWTFVLRVLPSFERYKPVVPLSAAIRAHAAADDVILQYNVSMPSMVYYLRRHIDITFDQDEFVAAIRKPGRAYAVLYANDYAALAPAIGLSTCVIERRSTVNVKLKALLAREPLPEVLLITNRCN